jgi:hypothetical protein
MTFSAEDRLAVEDLLARHVWALDRGDVESFVAAFTADGVLETADRHAGHAAIRDFAKLVRLSDPWQPGSQHIVSSVWLEGDADRCIAHSYITRVHRLPTRERNNTQVVWSGYATDTCVKVDGEWRFERRVLRAWEGDVQEAIAAARATGDSRNER